MKLFTRYNQILLAISLAGLLLIGFQFYRTLSDYQDRQLDEVLTEELMEVQDFTHVRNILPAPFLFNDLVIEYKEVPALSSGKIFGDTVFFNPKKKQEEAARFLRNVFPVNGKNIRVLIMVSKVDRQVQIRQIALAILLPVLALVVVLLLVNRVLVQRLWHPYRELLLHIRSFNLNKDQSFQPVETPVIEFRELNDAIMEMSTKVRADFQDIKLFTENASHEMMTPLAVINSRLDTLLQNNALSVQESETLSDLYKATARLTKLNQSLLLLVKIDHNLLRDQENMDLREVVEEKVAFFDELLRKRDLSILCDLQETPLFASRQLIEILVSNLFSNAIRHNVHGGWIKISLQSHRLTIRNTGPEEALDPAKIFIRFYKDPSSDGTGLGLSILKQICNRYGYGLDYALENGMHTFHITFY